MHYDGKGCGMIRGPTPHLPDRMPPIPPDEWTPEQAVAVNDLFKGPRGGLIGPFVPMMRAPELMNYVQKLGAPLRFGGRLPGDLRELAILLVALRWSQPVEWAIHKPIALREGVSPATVEALERGAWVAGAAPGERAVLDGWRELDGTGGLSDETYGVLLGLLGEAGVVELCCVFGYYTMLAMLMNVARTPPPSKSR
jgi:4-carboxymuconolactone decarboxylase